MRQFKFANGSIALVDNVDYQFLSQWIWLIRRENNGKFRVYRYEQQGQKRKYITIEREIAERMGLDLSKLIDHKDRDPLNNTRLNLREATYSQNLANSGLDRNNRSGYKGVSFDKRANKWRAKIECNGRHIGLGLHSDIEDAAEAYDQAATHYFGEFAVLNFPKEHR